MSEALWFSTLSGLSAFLGVGAVLWFGQLSRKMFASTLSLSATVMLLVAFFELLPTAIQVEASFSHLALGMSLALLLMLLLHRWLDRQATNSEGVDGYDRLGWYFASAIIAHNIPEGAAIGVGFSTDHGLGMTLALAMAVHNIPEGVGLAAPLLAGGRSPLFIVGVSLLAGSALPLGTWLGIQFLSSSDAVAVGLFFAVTTMVWVVVMEVMPQAWRVHRVAAIYGLALGVLLSWGLHLFHG